MDLVPIISWLGVTEQEEKPLLSHLIPEWDLFPTASEINTNGKKKKKSPDSPKILLTVFHDQPRVHLFFNLGEKNYCLNHLM